MNKICTDIEQSKKLIELGIDVNTADMMWDDWSLIDEGWKSIVGYYPEIEKDYGRKCYPAWSLAALLEQFEDTVGLAKDYGLWFCYDNRKSYCSKHYDNPVDAAVEMFNKLKEKDLL
jgi:hypothetical protein